MKLSPAPTMASNTAKDTASFAVHPKTLPPRHRGATRKLDRPKVRRCMEISGALPWLFYCRHAPLGRKFLKLQCIVARHNAIGRAGELNHALLVLDIRCMVRLAERRAGLTLREVAIQVDAVRCQHEWRIAVDSQVLRSESVPRSRV